MTDLNESLDYFEEVKTKTVLDMVRDFAKVTEQKPNPALYETLIKEEFAEWLMETLPEEELKELADLVYVIYGYANAKGWDLITAIERVHENNAGRCYQPDGTIHRREDGKILKNKDYPKVKLGDLV